MNRDDAQLTPQFWAKRLESAPEARCAIFNGPAHHWRHIQDETRRHLARYLETGQSVLDAGCGYGALSECLPTRVDYRGVDFCPELIAAARKLYRHRAEQFQVADLRRPLPFRDGQFDWVVARSVEGPLGGLLPYDDWLFVRRELHRVGRRVLFLNMPNDPTQPMEARVEEHVATPAYTGGDLHVWFPDFASEAQRQPWVAAKLVVALAAEGVYCSPRLEPGRTHLAFVASFSSFLEAARGYNVQPRGHRVDGYLDFPDLTVVQYCWDLYPWKVRDVNDPDHERWLDYVEELKRARAVLVPSRAAAGSVRAFTGQEPAVVKTSVELWGCPADWVRDGGYVFDVMRDYPGDPNNDLVRATCEKLKLPLVQPRHNLGWGDFRKAVAGARVLVSAVREATTGGLTLLEGLALGKHVLIPNCETHGGREYLGGWADYFIADDPESFPRQLARLAAAPLCAEPHYTASRRGFVESEYSHAGFARRLADEFRRILNAQ